MPTRLTTNYASLTDPDEFESLVCDLCALEWDDANTQKFGRKGQKQYGVDIYGQPPVLRGMYRAAQCKLRTKRDSLSESEIETEVNEARGFAHPLETLIFATDAPRDTYTQIIIDQISAREMSANGFRVVAWFWDDITSRLAAYPRLLVKYYRDYFASLTTLPIVERLVDTPLRILSVKVDTLTVTSIEEHLTLRGIRIIEQRDLIGNISKRLITDLLPDGLLFSLGPAATESSDPSILQLAASTRMFEQHVDANCPAFVALPSELKTPFITCVDSLGGDPRRFQLLIDESPVSKIADRVYQSTFEYGYTRRGSLTTLDIVARANEVRPTSAFLDMDWHTRLSTSHFPSPDEWANVFIPALEAVTRQITGVGDMARIQINSQLPLPAAFALGFFFNIRIAHIGVWARKTGVSNFKQQFWLSDGVSVDMTCDLNWVRSLNGTSGHSAIVELTTFANIHTSVEAFVQQANIECDSWLRFSSNDDDASIDEGAAISFANQVGRVIRQLNVEGIADIHLFARIPSALAVLIGQRLHACGRIHLYWFDNPTYRFAFTLK
jgi:hypothetical protein